MLCLLLAVVGESRDKLTRSRDGAFSVHKRSEDITIRASEKSVAPGPPRGIYFCVRDPALHSGENARERQPPSCGRKILALSQERVSNYHYSQTPGACLRWHYLCSFPPSRHSFSRLHSRVHTPPSICPGESYLFVAAVRLQVRLSPTEHSWASRELIWDVALLA